MELEIANAHIKVLEEKNAQLAAMVNFLMSQPTPAAMEYQRLVTKASADKKAEAEAAQKARAVAEA